MAQACQLMRPCVAQAADCTGKFLATSFSFAIHAHSFKGILESKHSPSLMNINPMERHDRPLVTEIRCEYRG